MAGMEPLTVDEALADYWEAFLAARYEMEAEYHNSTFTPMAQVPVPTDVQDRVDGALPDDFTGETAVYAPTGLYTVDGEVRYGQVVADVEGAAAYALAAEPERAPDPVDAFFAREE